MEEEQIIKDIVDTLYGNDNLYKDKNKDEIKQIRKQKDEKYDEIFRQINAVCERIENDLRLTLESEDIELGKIVRTNVVEAIQIEVSNGNSILNSNGKINGDKIYTSVLKKKEKIVNQVNSKTSENQRDGLNERIGKNITGEEQQKEEIRNRINNLDLGLSKKQSKRLESMMFNAENIIKMYNDLIEKKQLTFDEALEEIIKGKTSEEIIQITNALNAYIVVNVMESEQKETINDEIDESQSVIDNKTLQEAEETEKIGDRGVKKETEKTTDQQKENQDNSNQMPTRAYTGTDKRIAKDFIHAVTLDETPNTVWNIPEEAVAKVATAEMMDALRLSMQLNSMARRVHSVAKEVNDLGNEVIEPETYLEVEPIEAIPIEFTPIEVTKISEVIMEEYFRFGEVEMIGPYDGIEQETESALPEMQGMREYLSFLGTTDVGTNDLTQEAVEIKTILEENKEKSEDKKQLDNHDQDGEEFDK